MTSTLTETLLAPLTPEQQGLIDLVAQAFLDEEYEWPLFHYLEYRLDEEGRDVWDVLQSLPRVGRWGYGPVAWLGGGPMKPNPETEVALTIAGIGQSQALRDHLETLYLLIEYMAKERRAARPSPRKIIEATASSSGFADHCRNNRRLEVPSPRLTWQLLEREPPGLFGSRGFDPETHAWTRVVSREVLDLEGVQSLTEYLARLEQWLLPDSPVPAFSAPEIPLPAAIDHLDDVWRLTFQSRLFQLTGAERLASLVVEASSREEYEARLSVVGDLLRSANANLEVGRGKTSRDGLSRLERTIASRVGPDAQARTAEAVALLEDVLALRDSRQHAAASHRGMSPAQRLGLPVPISDWASAWQTVAARLVQAFGVIGDELRATLG